MLSEETKSIGWTDEMVRNIGDDAMAREIKMAKAAVRMAKDALDDAERRLRAMEEVRKVREVL